MKAVHLGSSAQPVPRPVLSRAAPRATQVTVQSMASLGINVFVGHIPAALDDDKLLVLLEQCGKVLSWNRMYSFVHERFRDFGFCKYAEPTGAMKCLRLLTDLPVGGPRGGTLIVMVSETAKERLEKYKDEMQSLAGSLGNVVDTDDSTAKLVIEKIIADVSGTNRESRKRRDHSDEGDRRKRRHRSYRDYDEHRPPPPPPPPPVTASVNDDVEEGQILPDSHPSSRDRARSSHSRSRRESESSGRDRDYSLSSRHDRSEDPRHPLREELPKSKIELLRIPLKWDVVCSSRFIDRKLRPWLSEALVKYIGSRDADFLEFIVQLVQSRTPPELIINELQPVMMNDTDNFFVDLWRHLIMQSD